MLEPLEGSTGRQSLAVLLCLPLGPRSRGSKKEERERWTKMEGGVTERRCRCGRTPGATPWKIKKAKIKREKKGAVSPAIRHRVPQWPSVPSPRSATQCLHRPRGFWAANHSAARTERCFPSLCLTRLHRDTGCAKAPREMLLLAECQVRLQNVYSVSDGLCVSLLQVCIRTFVAVPSTRPLLLPENEKVGPFFSSLAVSGRARIHGAAGTLRPAVPRHSRAGVSGWSLWLWAGLWNAV